MLKPVHYTGLASNDTPTAIRAIMTELAMELESSGIILRSAAHPEMHSAFLRGVEAVGKKEVYVTWSHGRHSQHRIHPSQIDSATKALSLSIIQRFLPHMTVSQITQHDFISMAPYLILGRDLNTPSRFVICWTPDGLGQHGVGPALRIARYYGIPVFDLGCSKSLAAFRNFKTLLR